MQTVKRLLLVGGGHAHVEVLRRFAMAPMAGVEIALVSPQEFTPYSGMLPGFVAGHYRWRECHIDLQALCHRARASFRVTAATGIDPIRQHVVCANGPVQSYDVLSLDVGSTSAVASIPGAKCIGIQVKPVDEFLRAIDALVQFASVSLSPRITVVGAGAAGVEICLALAFRLGARRPNIHLICATDHVLPGHNALARTLLMGRLRAQSIAVHLGKSVGLAQPGQLTLSDGSRLEFDQVIWATGALAPAWLGDCGFTLTRDGYVLVNDRLQSVSHRNVFAAGDMATIHHHPRPKSGVFAVRQGPALTENLRRAIEDVPLRSYRPQKRALALIGTGPHHAIASWGPLAWSGDWVWRWKDSIDRTFMKRYVMD